MLQRLFTRSIEGMLMLAFSQLILGFAILLRLLPTLLRGLVTLGRVILILSYRLYDLILELVAPTAASYGIVITAGLWRVGATVLLSNLIGLTGWLVLGWHITTLVVVVFVVHGLIVGLAWGALEQPGGLQLGVKIE